jgi:hypothetical protein
LLLLMMLLLLLPLLLIRCVVLRLRSSDEVGSIAFFIGSTGRDEG